MIKNRVDRLCVEAGAVESRALAQKLIEEGGIVFRRGDVTFTPTKSSQPLPWDYDTNTLVQVVESPLRRYVSRGGLKLEGALTHVALDVTGLRVLDVGLSTGGFSDCLLQRGAEKCVGIDTGEDQLHPSLQRHPRLVSLEKTKAHGVDISFLVQKNDGVLFDLFVIDVSFISLTKVVAPLLPALKPGGLLLALVKPQFEVGAQSLSKRGIVKDLGKLQELEFTMKEYFTLLGLSVTAYFESSLLGGDGNREFFIYAQKK